MNTLPNRDALRAAFDAVVREIDQSRDKPMLTTAFYSKIGDSVFDACYRALEDYCGVQGDPTARKSPPPLHVVSAPVGAGKTSFSVAFITALVRMYEGDPDAPFRSLFVADQIVKADEVYRQLVKLLPGKVAIWTTDHDNSEKRREKAKVQVSEEDRFDVDDLRLRPVAVVTHAFYSGSRGYKARNVFIQGRIADRALTIVDEQPTQVGIYAVKYSQVAEVWEHVADDAALAENDRQPVLDLDCFMANRTTASGELEKPSDNAEAWSAMNTLQWFNDPRALKYAQAKQQEVPAIGHVFAFARALANGYAFIYRPAGGNGAPQFIGYESNLMRAHGMVLLDATADIDGVTQLCPWREMQPMPQARFDNLSIVHVPSPTRERASEFLKYAKNRRAYVEHMERIIREQMQPGEKGLAVVKKRLLDDEAVPRTPEGGYTWDVDGRRLSVTHWGVGIGANHWKDADVVFLFDEFYIPRRAAIATAQGLREHKATQGALAKMTRQNSSHADVDAVWEGHLLRWNKQMALRGKGRCYDEYGLCGKQKLVMMGDVDRLLTNKDRLFPGASVTTVISDDGSRQTHAQKLYALLSTEGLPSTLTTQWIGQQLKTPWRDVSKHLIGNGSVMLSIEALGWRYVSKRGRGGSYFERIAAGAAIAA